VLGGKEDLKNYKIRKRIFEAMISCHMRKADKGANCVIAVVKKEQSILIKKSLYLLIIY
jgi:hypothetical protein